MPRKSSSYGRLVPLAVFGLLALLVFGCGGGGGGGGNGSTGQVGTPTAIAAVALYQGTQSPASPFVTSTGTNYQLEAGDVVQIELIGTNSVTQQPEQVSASNFTISAPSSVATITSTGLLKAVAASPGVEYTFSATYAGTVYSAYFQVNPLSAKVTGSVRDTEDNLVAGVVVSFYNSQGTVIAQTVSGADGSFISNVPQAADQFSANPSAVTYPGYFEEYAYGSYYYSSTSSSCFTPLPTLTNGKSTALPNQIVLFPSNDPNSPPPPPTGCGG